MRARLRARIGSPLVILAALIAAFADPQPAASAAGGADLGIAMSVNPVAIPVAGIATFTVVVTNHGHSKAKVITVSDPFGITWSGVTCAADRGGVCQQRGYGYVVTFPALARGEAATITFVATAKGSVASGNTLTNSASVSAATDDPDGTNNSASVTVRIE